MKNIITASLLALFATSVYAEDVTIEMLNKRDDGAKWFIAKTLHVLM